MSESGGFRPPTGPPAGWYPDPYDPHGERYWDGRQWDLSSPVEHAPDTDRFPEIGDWLDHSFRSGLRRWRAVTVQALLTSVLSTVLIYLGLARLVDGLTIDGNEVVGWSSDRLSVVIPLMAAGFLVSAIGGVGLFWLMLQEVDRADGDVHTFGSEVRAGLRSVWAGVRLLPRTFGWTLLLALGIAAGVLVLAVVGVLLGPAAVLVALVFLPLFVWLSIKWAFLIVAVVDHRGNPYPRSSRVSDGRWWSTLGRLLLIAIIIWLIGAAIQTVISLATGSGLGGVGSGLQFTLDESGQIDRVVLDDEVQIGALVIVGAAVTSLLSTVLTSSVMAAGMAYLYRTRNRHA